MTRLYSFTAWDLGYSDQTAIIWFQTMGNEVRIIDCYENNREDVVHRGNNCTGENHCGCLRG